VGAALGVGLFALVFERLFMSRVYGADVLLQLLVCYGFILILDDAVKIIWGAEFLAMGMPPLSSDRRSCSPAACCRCSTCS
jgi:branched-chain amino acid transport system permease protein